MSEGVLFHIFLYCFRNTLWTHSAVFVLILNRHCAKPIHMYSISFLFWLNENLQRILFRFCFGACRFPFEFFSLCIMVISVYPKETPFISIRQGTHRKWMIFFSISDMLYASTCTGAHNHALLTEHTFLHLYLLSSPFTRVCVDVDRNRCIETRLTHTDGPLNSHLRLLFAFCLFLCGTYTVWRIYMCAQIHAGGVQTKSRHLKEQEKLSSVIWQNVYNICGSP